MNALKRKLDEANEKLQMIEATKLTLEFKLKSAEASDSKLKETIQFLEEGVSQLQLEKEEIEIGLRKEITEARNAKRNLEKAMSETKEELENQIAEENQKVIELQAEVSMLKRNYEERISIMVSEKKQAVSILEAKNDDLESKIEKLLITLEEAESELKSLQSQLFLKDSLIKTSNLDLAALEASHNSLLTEVETLKDSLKASLAKISDNNTSLASLQSTIDHLTLFNKALEEKLSSAEEHVRQLESEKAQHEEHFSLSEINIKQHKRPVHEAETSEFERGLELSMEERLTLESNTIAVVRVVLYDSRTWCLVRVAGNSYKYAWYEKYLLEEINTEIHCPVPYETELEQKIALLEQDCEQVLEIRELHFPEELQEKKLFAVVETLLAAYANSRKSIARPIQVMEYDPDLHESPVSGLDAAGKMQEKGLDSPMQVTAEEAVTLFAKMKNLEEENMELENRIMLLNQQLLHFKNEGKTSQFGGKSTATIEQVKSISVSLFEKLPVQADDVESNIKVMLEIMGMNKDAQEKLNERRGIKNSPAKKSSFKKLFSKQKS